MKRTKSQASKKQESLCEGVFGEARLRTTLIAFVLTSLCQQSSLNVWNMYSVRIVTNLNSNLPPESTIQANTFTQILGVAMWIAALCSFLVVRQFKLRKQLMLWGVLLVALTLVCCALSMQLRSGYATMFFAVAFELCYGMTMGPVHWIYVPEMLTDL